MNRLLSLILALFATTGQAQTTLPELLEEIELQLLQKRPDFFTSLRPPLTEEQIAAIEIKYATILPDDVKALYMWHDGQDPQKFSSFVNNMQFQPLEYMLSAKVELDGMIGYDFELENWWNRGWLPIFHNGGGDHLVVDTVGVHTGNAGQLLTVYHDWEHRPIEAQNLQVFMQAVLAYYENTLTENMDEFHVLENFLTETGQSFVASGVAMPLQQ